MRFFSVYDLYKKAGYTAGYSQKRKRAQTNNFFLLRNMCYGNITICCASMSRDSHLCSTESIENKNAESSLEVVLFV